MRADAALDTLRDALDRATTRVADATRPAKRVQLVGQVVRGADYEKVRRHWMARVPDEVRPGRASWRPMSSRSICGP